MTETLLRRLTIASFTGLLLLVVLWEGWLAPSSYAPPWVWLVVKLLPLLALLPGLMRDHQGVLLFGSVLVLLYFIEGVVLTWVYRLHPLSTDNPLIYATLEWLLALAFFALVLLYLRRRQRQS